MPTFNLPSSGDSGKPNSPRQSGVHAPRCQTWSWTASASETLRLYSVVCLTDDALFVPCKDFSFDDRPPDLSRLAHEQPEAVFGRRFVRIPLASIQRFRFHVYYAWIDVIRDDGSMQTIRDFETRKTEQIFDALHKRLAPRAPIEREAVRVEREAFTAIAVFAPITAGAGIFLSGSLASEEELGKLSRTDFRVMLIESIGASMTTLLGVAAILAGLAFIAYRVFNPPKTLAVIVKPARPGR